MSTRARLAILALTTLAGQVSAQSFNIEVGSANTVPSNLFGAAAASPGTWNAVNAGTAASITLKNLDGSNSAVTMTHSTAGSFFSNNNANLTGNYSNLLSDVQAHTSPITYSFTGLQPGQYNIYTYAVDVQSSFNACHVLVNNAQGIVNQDSGLKVPTGNQFHIGGTHALHARIVNIGDTVTVTINPSGLGAAQVAGISAVQIPRRMKKNVGELVQKLALG